MSDRKQITINPDLFNVSGKTRKKQKNPDEGTPIRIKSSTSVKHNKTTKGKVLRYIREQQEKNYQKLFQENNTNIIPEKIYNAVNPLAESTSDFENSIAYLKNIEETQKDKIPQHTIKNRQIEHTLFDDAHTVLNQYANISQNVGLNLPVNGGSADSIQLNSKHNLLPPPTYGCLKNGNLPTYRNMMNRTAKSDTFISGAGSNPDPNTHHHPTIVLNNMQPNNMPSNNMQSNNMQPNNMQSNNNNIISNPNYSYNAPPPTTTNESYNIISPSSNLKEQLKKQHVQKIIQNKQLSQKIEDKKNAPTKIRGLKQKKTIRRTYHTGKSKVFSKVGVLVSNKTIRKKITTQMHLLKQTPLEEVRKYLIKKGLIKIGSTAPNDILRQMFENSILIGGELTNHNTENLLFNYMNDAAPI